MSLNDGTFAPMPAMSSSDLGSYERGPESWLLLLLSRWTERGPEMLSEESVSDSPCSHGIFASGLATIHCIAIRSESVGRRFLRRTNGNVCASYV